MTWKRYLLIELYSTQTQVDIIIRPTLTCRRMFCDNSGFAGLYKETK